MAQPADKGGAAPTAQGDLGITIYNGDLALVEDRRQLALPAGVSRQEFPDVSASIRPETATLSGEGFDILEQNFDFDLLSPTAMMQKAVGQSVTLLRTNPATGAESRERATVLAVNGGAVLRIADRIEILRDDGLPVRVIFDTIPPNLRARPTLSVTVEAARAGPRPVTLSYLTTGLKWKADYVARFDETAGKLDVQGWVTLTNSTGTTFNSARTLLAAGDVAGVQHPRRPDEPAYGNRPGTETAERAQVGDLYLYPIKGRTTIADAQTKQVSFLEASGVPAAKGYEFRNEWLGRTDDPKSAATILKFSSARAGGLGDALPAGTVRVYMRDAHGDAQFIGESEIPHTPMGSSLALRTGDAFDVKVQPAIEKREKIQSDEWERSARFRITRSDGTVTTTQVDTQKEFWRTTMRYVLTNARPQPVTVDLIQAGLSNPWSDTRVPSESLPGEQMSLDQRVWHVTVPANGKTIVTAVFETR
ncbi:MAG: DUF4139 domain-containing protein [Alphaproteobacteria bacterium]|nr:DUF4139 domain-containing protein [Alphaproteobacteria bacterium]MBV9899474.1 DUF4139 domain-containing protein [Alphaproteobacteria bacterium]